MEKTNHPDEMQNSCVSIAFHHSIVLRNSEDAGPDSWYQMTRTLNSVIRNNGGEPSHAHI
jgi:hypothetical protein